MIYKIVLSNTKDTIPVAEEDLLNVLKSIQEGGNVIITKEGVFNPSFYVGILADHERSKEEEELKISEKESFDLYSKYHIPNSPKPEHKEYLTSPFSKLLSAKMTMLPNPKDRTEIQEGVAKEERKIKSGNL